MDRTFFGLTMADVVSLANQFVVRNGIKNEFCKRNEKAGMKWLKNFLRHHQEISVKPLKVLTLKSEGLHS